MGGVGGGGGGVGKENLHKMSVCDWTDLKCCSFFLFFLPPPPPANPSLNSSSHRGHDPLDRGGRLLLPLGLVHQRHAEVTEAERHALQDGLTRVGPVFRKLCKRRAKKGLKKIKKKN